MKKTALISVMICSIILNFTACININPGKSIEGNGILKEQDRGKMEFNVIDTRGAFSIFISDITDAPVTISGDENLIEYIETSVKDGVLTIKFKDEDKVYRSFTSKMGLKVTVPNNGHINSIKASGASVITVEGIIITDNMSIMCAGSSDFNGSIVAEICNVNCAGSSNFSGNVEATTFIIKCAGSSNCNMSGKADVCEITSVGSCDFKGYDFIVNKLKCSATGASNIQITCNEEISVNAVGSSNVYYRGSAEVVSRKSVGSSEIVNM